MTPALTVCDLGIELLSGDRSRRVVDGVSFELAAGEVLALVGESGCGKSKTAEAIMGLLPRRSARVEARHLRLGETELLRQPESVLRGIRGRRMSMVFQEPLTALDPVFSCGSQLATLFRRHLGQSRAQALLSAQTMLRDVGFADTGRIMHSYPHQLSGGMRQRVVIAMAMACRPEVLIADEPTTALDVTTQALVLEQLLRLGRERGTAILLITHDLGVVAQYADRALVMRHGRIIEDSPVETLFAQPEQGYTRELLAATRALET